MPVPYAVECGDVSWTEQYILGAADQFYDAVFAVAKETVTCHSLCERWVTAKSDLSASWMQGRHVRGRYAQVFAHSWIEIRPGLLLDLYPVAQVRPLLIATTHASLAALYEEISEEEAERRRQHKLNQMLEDLRSRSPE